MFSGDRWQASGLSDGRLLAEFKRQREQIDATMQSSKTATAMAQRDAMR